jgi:hypothetical protein
LCPRYVGAERISEIPTTKTCKAPRSEHSVSGQFDRLTREGCDACGNNVLAAVVRGIWPEASKSTDHSEHLCDRTRARCQIIVHGPPEYLADALLLADSHRRIAVWVSHNDTNALEQILKVGMTRFTRCASVIDETGHRLKDCLVQSEHKRRVGHGTHYRTWPRPRADFLGQVVPNRSALIGSD